jgi:hypothetical protein
VPPSLCLSPAPTDTSPASKGSAIAAKCNTTLSAPCRSSPASLYLALLLNTNRKTCVPTALRALGGLLFNAPTSTASFGTPPKSSLFRLTPRDVAAVAVFRASSTRSARFPNAASSTPPLLLRPYQPPPSPPKPATLTFACALSASTT